MGLINYLGESKVIKKICELLNVKDVKVNGTSVVDASGDANVNVVDWVSNAFLGAKNLNAMPYYYESREINGIIWTVNADGTVTANGTATAQSTFVIHSRSSVTNAFVLQNGNYIISGCPSGGGANKYYLASGRTSGGAYSGLGNEYGSGKTITLNGDDYSDAEVRLHFAIVIVSGQTVNNIVFKPMIRLPGDDDGTFCPYAMTNKELTNKITNIEQIFNQDNIPTTETSYVCEWSKFKLLNITLGIYNNVCSQISIPTSEFANSSNGRRVLIYFIPTPSSSPPYYEIYKKDNSNIYVVGHNVNSVHRVKIYGCL